MLRNCFAASPLFAKYSIPLILDKLDSDIDSAKLDSLLTFVLKFLDKNLNYSYVICNFFKVECTKVYDAADYKEYIEQLWNNFQKLVNLI